MLINFTISLSLRIFILVPSHEDQLCPYAYGLSHMRIRAAHTQMGRPFSASPTMQRISACMRIDTSDHEHCPSCSIHLHVCTNSLAYGGSSPMQTLL